MIHRPLRLALVLVVSSCGSPADDSAPAEDSGGNGGIVAGDGSAGVGGKTSAGGSTGVGGKTSAGGSTGVGGKTSAGGSTGTGGKTSAGGSTGTGGAPPKNVLPCDQIAEIGQWENVTPPEIAAKITGNANDAMTNRFAVDPVNSGTLYLGGNHTGIWKTTDCGSSWVRVNTGRNGSALDCSLQWNFKIDPVNPKVLYANAGYGCQGSGLWKSTDSGVDWDEIWPKNATGIASPNGFVGENVVDPANPQHLLLSFHEAPDIAESMDGGATWRLVTWRGAGVWLLDSTTWMSPIRDQGLWRTSDSGATWAQVSGASSSSHTEGFMYRAGNGVYYIGAQEGVVRSVDGISWNVVPNSGNLVKGITGDGTSIFASSGGVPWLLDKAIQPYKTSPESDGTTFTQMPSPLLNPGADDLQCDRDHHILYSSNCMGGFWRVRTQ